jgi:hypothetical protein
MTQSEYYAKIFIIFFIIFLLYSSESAKHIQYGYLIFYFLSLYLFIPISRCFFVYAESLLLKISAKNKYICNLQTIFTES